jgi:predicted dehydrogenase
MKRTISMGIIGVGWIGGLRARTCATRPLVESLHLCEIDRERLQQMAKETGARSATTDYRVFSQYAYGVMRAAHGLPDSQWIMVTMDDGTAFTIGAGWALPPGYPHFSTATIEFHGTEGALLVDDSHRDIVLNTMGKGMVLPLSTMPGEPVGHVYQGPMQAETIHSSRRSPSAVRCWSRRSRHGRLWK